MDSFLIGYDFYYLYAATALWWRGANPYEIAAFTQELNSIGWPATEGVQGLTHPPITELFALPFVLFNFQIAKWLWLCLVSSILVFCGWWIFNDQHLRKLHGFKEPLPYSLTFATFPPVISNVMWGQHNVIPFLGITGFLAYLCKGRLLTAGVFLSLTTLKPHLLFPFYVFLFGYALLSGRIRLLAGFIGGIAVQCGLTWIVNPNSFQNYIQSFANIGADARQLFGASLTQNVSVYLHMPSLLGVAMALACLMAIICLLTKRFSEERLFGIFLPLSFVAAPYVWNHSFVLLALPYLRLINLGFVGFGPAFRFVVAAIGAVGVFIGLMADLNPYTAVFPLVLLGSYFMPFREHQAVQPGQ